MTFVIIEDLMLSTNIDFEEQKAEGDTIEEDKH